MDIQLLYFSPTHSSKATGEIVAGELARQLGQPFAAVSATLPAERQAALHFADSLVVCAFPVYGGRMPKPFSQFLAKLACENCQAIPIAVYGNRAIDDALREASDLLAASGAQVIAAIAAVAQHAFDASIAAGRPDEIDRKNLEDFAQRITGKIRSGKTGAPVLPGQSPYKEPGPSAPILPLTSGKCNFCGVCARLCPMGVIDDADEHIINPGCILCSACVKFCPQGAKSLPQPFLLKVSQMLAKAASGPKQAQLFL